MNPYVHGLAVMLALAGGALAAFGSGDTRRLALVLLVVALVIDAVEFVRYRRRRRAGR